MNDPANLDASPLWRRVVRHAPDGRVLDWVEVGQCATCGRGVDREFPSEYREVAGSLLCRECSPPTGTAAAGRRGHDAVGGVPGVTPA